MMQWHQFVLWRDIKKTARLVGDRALLLRRDRHPLKSSPFQIPNQPRKIPKRCLLIGTQQQGLVGIKRVKAGLELVEGGGGVVVVVAPVDIDGEGDGGFEGLGGGVAFGEVDGDGALLEEGGRRQHDHQQHQHDVDEGDDVDAVEAFASHGAGVPLCLPSSWRISHSASRLST